MSGAGRGEGRGLSFSIEIFPPKEPDARASLAERLGELAPIAPGFVSVTYGAGGTTRDRTLEMVARVVNDTPLEVAAHLTCVGASTGEVDDLVGCYRDGGVGRIVALRGDPPGGLNVPYHPHPEGYQRTADLVAAIRRRGDFDVSVAAYPEKHPQSPDFDADLDTLEAKIDAGAARALTQFFFDNAMFLTFLERVRARGISAPIVPGILPVVNFRQVSAFAASCGATVPDWLAERFAGLDDDPAARTEIGVDIAARQIAGLAAAGQQSFHIYCLNRPEIVRALWDRLGAGARATAAA
jgi:methylenetetrahydrofolate reductase (NADPH)